MNIILLPGNSLSNKEWIDKTADTMRSGFESSIVQYYDHWERGGDLIDIGKEVEKLAVSVKKLNSYVIFAKSAGVLVTLKSIKDKKIDPKKCVFVGTPVNWAKEKDIIFQDWFKLFSVPTLFIQHTGDPVISSSDLKNFLNENGVSNFKFLELPGNSHDYPELDTLTKFTLEFVYGN